MNLLSVGISSYNTKLHVPSDIPVHNGYIDADKLETQKNLDTIQNWTENQKMKLNTKKSNIMIFNFSKNKQFTTRIKLGGEHLDVIEQTKLLGTTLTSDLK